MKLFGKITPVFWTLIILILLGVIIAKSSIGTNIEDKIKIFSGLISIIGISFVAVQLQIQKKNNTITTEFLNQPNFDFLAFEEPVEREKNIIGSSPVYCKPLEINSINYNECSDIHWFNIKQIGKLPAKDIRITLICPDETNDISNLTATRTQFVPLLHTNIKHQFKLPEHAISLEHFKTKKNSYFFILIEYISVYSNIKYKRVYELHYSPMIAPLEIPSSWVKNIKYFDFTLSKYMDSRTLTVKEIFKNFWNKAANKANLKKPISIEDWCIDI